MQGISPNMGDSHHWDIQNCSMLITYIITKNVVTNQISCSPPTEVGFIAMEFSSLLFTREHASDDGTLCTVSKTILIKFDTYLIQLSP